MKRIFAFTAVLCLFSSAFSCSGKDEKATQEHKPELSVNGKTIVRVGNFGFRCDAFSDTINFPKDIQLEEHNYSKDAENIDDAMHELDMDILQGNAPDIIFTSAEYMDRLIRKDAMADMFQLMDDYGGIQREDFLPNALESLTVDGKLPAVVDSFMIKTAIAKTKFVEEKYNNWTPDEAMSFYEKYDGQMAFIDDNNELLADYMLKLLGRNCIDYENCTCDFSGDFLDVLIFCAEHPVNEKAIPDFSRMSDIDRNAYTDDELTRGMRDAQLVFPITITGLNSEFADNAYVRMNKEDITFVGMPSTDGNGTYAMVSAATAVPYGILKSSANKEAAWKLVCHILRHRKKLETYQNDCTRGIPVLKSQFDFDAELSESYSVSINGTFSNHVRGMQNEEPFYIPNDVKEKLKNYILNVKFNIYTQSVVDEMIDEECKPVLAGERTPEQAVEILKNRISLYLSENS